MSPGLRKLIEQAARSRAQAEVQRAAAAWGRPGGTAAGVLLAPGAEEALADATKFFASQGVKSPSYLGQGMESVVLDGGDVVAKLSSLPHTFRYAPDVPGVAAYLATEDFGPLRAAIQWKAKHTRPENADIFTYRGVADEPTYWQWQRAADNVQQSLRDRGLEWIDPHGGNIGVMPSGEAAVIDGAVMPMMGFTPRRSAEDAIRQLRIPFSELK